MKINSVTVMGTVSVTSCADKYESMYHDYSSCWSNKPKLLAVAALPVGSRCLMGSFCARITCYSFELVTLNFRIITEHEIAQMLTNYYDPE
jgi:hypothetical protein